MTDDEHQPGFVRRHRPALTLGLVVVALATTIAATITLSRDDPKPSPRQLPASATTTAPLGDAAAELVRLLEEGSRLAFDGRYSVSSAGGPGGTVRMWSRPPMLRVDTELGSGAELRRTAQFSLPSGSVGCSRQAEVWSCRSQPVSRGLGLLPEGFPALLSRYSVEARADRVGEHDARCFALSGPEGPPGELCLTADGVLARVRLAATDTVELVELDRSPPPSEIFHPPAPPS